MNKFITLTQPIFENLIEHLLYIEESADRLAVFFFPESEKDRENMKRFYRQYVKKIENQLKYN